MRNIASSDPSLLVFGSINVDLVASPDRLPKPGETVLASSYRIVGGGKGANQAVAAARARSNPTSRIMMVGAIGNDAFGDRALDELRADEVATDHVIRAIAPTGCAFVSVDPAGENLITVASGANWHARAEQLPANCLAPGSILLMQNEIPFGEIAKAAQMAHAAGATVVVNLAPAPEATAPRDIGVLLDAVDILVLNEHEHAIVCLALGLPHFQDLREGARQLANEYALDVVVTLGAEGLLLARPSSETSRQEAYPVSPVDTTGAGDTLTGVLAVSLLESHGLEDALHRSTKAAALSCLAHGARDGMPRADAINAFERSIARSAVQ